MGSVNGIGRRSFQSSPGTGLANDREKPQKNLWSFLTVGVKNPRIGVRKIVPYVHQRYNFSSSERREHAEGLRQSGSRRPWWGR